MKDTLQFLEFNDKNELVLAASDAGLMNRVVAMINVPQSFLDRCNVLKNEDLTKIGIIEIKIYAPDLSCPVERASIRFDDMVCDVHSYVLSLCLTINSIHPKQYRISVKTALLLLQYVCFVEILLLRLVLLWFRK
jgi:hypothetical protein